MLFVSPGEIALPSIQAIVLDPFTMLAQASPSPSPSPQPINPETVEFLKSQFSSLTTTFNIYVSLISAVAAVFVGFAAYFFKRTLSEAKQEVHQLVREAVQLEIAASIQKRVSVLEQVLEREEIPSLVSVDYLLQTASGSLPQEYRFLQARFPRLKARAIASRKFTGDVVVLDLVHYLPQTPPLSDPEVGQVLQEIADKISPETVLVVYVRGRYGAIEQLSSKVSHYTSANVPIQLLGTVTNSAYVAYTLRGD
jgi:hypothetical protein